MAAAAKKSWLERAELSSGKLLFYVIFWGGHFAVFAGGWYWQVINVQLAALNVLQYSVYISRGAALILTIDATLIILPMCRNVLRWLRPQIRWLPLDESAWFHRQVAYAILVFVVLHTGAHYVNFYNIEKQHIRPALAVEMHYKEAAGITGHVMLLCMMLMYTTSHHRIRQQAFETFWYTHHLFVPFLLALYTHATGCFVRNTPQPISPFAGNPFWGHCFGYEGWRWELVAASMYMFERLYREIRSRRETEITKVIRHPYDAMEIQFRKPSMKYKPGQWLFIQVPDVSSHQWHPFTITSCPFDPYISIHVRQVGDFTRALGDALGCGPAQAKDLEGLDPLGMYEVALQNGQMMPKIRIDGPYGAPAEDVFENEIAVLIGTGIGVTPWASILKNIWHLRSSPNPPRRLRRVEFIWICKDTSSFEWFQALLSSLESQSANAAAYEGSTEFLRIHTYLTQRLDNDTAANIYLNSVGQALDPLTELKSQTNFGRPDFKRLFTAMRNGLLDESYIQGLQTASTTEVGVYFCGPNAAARQINEAAKNASSKAVRFKFWKEHF
ncbi:Riboflavin synthase-like beta-barrel [Penicillium diatomitis]|uniref:Riboflavin synthase-like beta-barrel n=1 Tax=Penicillium diatomitis TaxID=2819901 RepID=A0A9W9X3E1_9EURO|nr:Riboflavin synthase-like beta-barrel [Penicillium diatomitis]KAJ5483006.1 Riboflavin synthase-like beta-barrel [Penicillium diatomitis]